MVNGDIGDAESNIESFKRMAFAGEFANLLNFCSSQFGESIAFAKN